MVILTCNYVLILHSYLAWCQTIELQETHDCTVATDTLALKHQAISIHSTD